MIYRPPKAEAGSATWIFSVLMGLIAVGVAVLVGHTIWGAATMRYEVTPSQAIIVYGPTVIGIDRDEIVDISYFESPTRGRRLVGTSMAGLKQGSWSFAETGRISLYATTTQDLVVIETDKGKWGISPADPEAFLAALDTGQPGTFRPVRQSALAGLIVSVVLVVALLGFAIGLALYMRRLTSTIRYELTDDALLIHGSLRPVRIPYAKIDSVRIETPGGHPWKTVGTSLPGLQWGSFSWKALGPNVKLYATRLQPLVVLRTGSQTVGLSPEDAKGFAQELQRRIEQD